MSSSGNELTQLLQQWRGGDANALDRLMPMVQGELKRIAKRYMNQERAEHTLQTTALVNEVYIKLAGTSETRWNDRAHFFAISAQLMRRILVDHARAQGAVKRGKNFERFSLEAAEAATAEEPFDILELNDALDALNEFDPLKREIIELHYFGGLTLEECGEVLELSMKQVWQHCQVANAWLSRAMSKDDSGGS